MQAKMIYGTDLSLVVWFAVTVFSGLELHAMEHVADLRGWRLWALVHLLFGVLFTLFTVLHVAAHWPWYKSLKRGLGRKSVLTLCLSVVIVPVVGTGFWLLFTAGGAGIHVGQFHYKTGILAGVLGFCHLLARFPLLVRGLKKSRGR